jgi:hypothetical protein
MALKQPFPNGARGLGLSVMRDKGGQPTSLAFIEASTTLGIQ